MELIPHPAAACPAVAGLEASCHRIRPAVLLLRYRLWGDLGRLHIPPPAPPGRADELWRHTCLEAFVQPAGQPRYSEFNLAPSTAWAAYGFDGYRSGMRPLEGLVAPQVAVEAAAGELRLTARIPLPAQAAGTRLRVGLTAVIEDRYGGHSWWALRHAGPKPDFHLAESFVFEC